jgi:hypothetical protein
MGRPGLPGQRRHGIGRDLYADRSRRRKIAAPRAKTPKPNAFSRPNSSVSARRYSRSRASCKACDAARPAAPARQSSKENPFAGKLYEKPQPRRSHPACRAAASSPTAWRRNGAPRSASMKGVTRRRCSAANPANSASAPLKRECRLPVANARRRSLRPTGPCLHARQHRRRRSAPARPCSTGRQSRRRPPNEPALA